MSILASLSPTPVFKAWDNNGNPLSGGLLYTYAAGTTTPLASYVDSTLTTQNTNPVVLNGRGECNLWLNPAQIYKLQLNDSSGNVIWTVDNIIPNPAQGLGSTLTFSAGGNVTIGVPTSGSSLTVNGNNLAAAEVINGSSTAGASFGLVINAGTNASDYALSILNSAQTSNLFQLWGDGHFGLGVLSGAPALQVQSGGTTLQTQDQAGTFFDIGWRDIPVNVQNSGAYQLQQSDRGKLVLDTIGGHNMFIPSNASQPFPVGSTISLLNTGGSNNLLAISLDTLYFLPSMATGTRTMAHGCMATITKILTTSWVVSGNSALT